MAFSGRESMANRIRPIVVNEQDRHELERLQRSPCAPAGLTRRARAVLMMAQGLPGVEIAERTGYTVVQVSRLRRHFAEYGVVGLHDRPRSGRPPTITARKRAQIIALTLRAPAPGVTHWSTRDLARQAGVSHGTVHQIWRAHALKPHRVSTFKFTTDPEAEDKIYDVVGLYLNPPTSAVVLSLDEKTQIQALSRTQPCCPCGPGCRRARPTTIAGMASRACTRRWRSPPGGSSETARPGTPARTSCDSSKRWFAATAAASCTSCSTTRPRIRPPPCRRGSISIPRST